MTTIAARYFAAMRGADLAAVMALFTPDAILCVPDGRKFEGRKAIEGWFAQLFASVAPSPRCVAEVVGERAVAVEIETTLHDGAVRRTANFFDLNERGRISGLRSYTRS